MTVLKYFVVLGIITASLFNVIDVYIYLHLVLLDKPLERIRGAPEQ